MKKWMTVVGVQEAFQQVGIECTNGLKGTFYLFKDLLGLKFMWSSEWLKAGWGTHDKASYQSCMGLV